LTLLLLSYASFGWFLSSTVVSPELSSPVEGPPLPAFLVWAVSRPLVARAILVLAIGWIWLITTALMNPLTSFSHFLTRWFKSDTVAFLTICMMAGMAALVLVWLHIFLYITTIVATEALARIDLQTLGYAEWQTFWVLAIFSMVGLILGWEAHTVLPGLLRLG
jgi:hypothetical protein